MVADVVRADAAGAAPGSGPDSRSLPPLKLEYCDVGVRCARCSAWVRRFARALVRRSERVELLVTLCRECAHMSDVDRSRFFAEGWTR